MTAGQEVLSRLFYYMAAKRKKAKQASYNYHQPIKRGLLNSLNHYKWIDETLSKTLALPVYLLRCFLRW